MNIKVEVKNMAQGLKGTFGLAIKNMVTGEEILWNEDEGFPFASVVKVNLLVELFRQVDEGKIRLDDKLIMSELIKAPGSGILQLLTPGLEMSVKDTSSLMMLISDNTATDMIFNRIGKNNVIRTMQELGLKRTIIRTTIRDLLFDLVGLKDIDPKKRTVDLYNEMTKPEKLVDLKREKPLDIDNYTTPRDMMVLLEKIYKGEAASKNSCNEIVELMKKCHTGGNRIIKYLPKDDVKVAHKTGSLRGVVNDVGIVFPKEGEPYTICCFVKELSDSSDGEDIIANISKLAYTYFS